MSFVVTYRGLPVQCDSIEDLNQLAEELESARAKDARRAKRTAAHSASARPTLFDNSTPDRSLRVLVRELKDNQKTLLTAISNSEQSDTELRALLHLGTNNKSLAGVLSGISKAAKRVGVDVPIEKKMSRSGNGEREYRYSIRPESVEEVQRALLNGHA